MLHSYFYLLFLSTMFLEFVTSQHSNTGFAYGELPKRPVLPERTRPVQVVRPATVRPRRPPSQGGSRYLRRKKPGKKNLDKSLLMELMGDDFQTSWMSDEKPQKLLISVPSNEVDLEGITDGWAQKRLFEQARELNLTAELSHLQPELLPFQDGIKSWLLKRSSCPVEFTWKDLGPTFWPRWVRRGECMDRKGSCSFPTGMHCVPAATTMVHILRWQCRERKMTIVKKSASESKTTDDAMLKRRAIEPNAKASDEVMHGRRVAKRRTLNDKTADEVMHGRRVAKRRTPIDKTADEVMYRRRVSERYTQNDKTADEVTYRRRMAQRRLPNAKTADEVIYRRRVADVNPEQQRRKKRCDWYRVPFPITIECYCTC